MKQSGIREIPGDVLQPFVALIVFVNRGNFPKLVQAENKVDHKRRKMKNEGAEKAQRNRNAPHDDGVAQKAKAGVAAGAEDAGNHRGIDCLADYIV